MGCGRAYAYLMMCARPFPCLLSHSLPPPPQTPSPQQQRRRRQISQWHKKVVLVLNQIDLRPTPEEVAEVEAYVRNNARYARMRASCAVKYILMHHVYLSNTTPPHSTHP